MLETLYFFAHNLSPGDEEFIYVLLYNTNTSKKLDYLVEKGYVFDGVSFISRKN